MSDRIGRLNVLRVMIAISMIAMPLMSLTAGSAAWLYAAVFVIYWCYGAQLSINGAAASDFWGTRHAGLNYGLLFTAWGVAGVLGPRIAGVLFDRYQNYNAALYAAALLAGVALLCLAGARAPSQTA
jgi:OFA family oxalate/formate antiporter-like MFS transporter